MSPIVSDCVGIGGDLGVVEQTFTIEYVLLPRYH